MDVSKMFFLSTFFAVVEETLQLNLDLIFGLQKFFKSDVILIEKNKQNCDESMKTFFKFNSHKALRGVINLDDNLFVHNFERERMFHKNILIVSDSNVSSDNLKKITSPSIMASVIWVYFVATEFANKISDLHIPYNSKFFLIKKINNSDFEILDVYQISKNSPKIYSIFGYYKKEKIYIAEESFYSRRRDLRGHQFVVSLSYFPEYEEKFGYIWQLFSQAMNFSVFSNFTAAGAILPDGTKTGLMKMVDEHEIDGTAINYLVTNERLDHFDYIFPTVISETRMYVNLKGELNWTSYIAPFSSEVWVSIAAWIILASIIVHAMIRSKKIKNINFMDSLFEVLRALCYQAGNLNISSILFYISNLMPYLLAIILVQYYSGRLLSYLTVKNLVLPFRNLRGIIEDGSYTLIVPKGTYYDTYFQTSQGHDATALRDKAILESPDKMPVLSSDGFHKLCQGNYVFLCESATESIITEDCNIFEINTILFYQSWGILVRKGFPYKNDIIKTMRQIQFSGLVKLKYKNIIVKKDDSNDFQPLSIEIIFPIFFLHFSIITLSGFILLLEIYFKKHSGNIVEILRKIKKKCV